MIIISELQSKREYKMEFQNNNKNEFYITVFKVIGTN